MSHSRLLTGFVTRVTQWVSLVKQELLTLPKYLSSLPVFSEVRVTRSLVLCVMCYRSLFVLLFFFFCLLCCLFVDLRILVTTLVSSNSSSTESFVLVVRLNSSSTESIVLVVRLNSSSTESFVLVVRLNSCLKVLQSPSWIASSNHVFSTLTTFHRMFLHAYQYRSHYWRRNCLSIRNNWVRNRF